MEHPAPSDNGSENPEENQDKKQHQQPSGFVHSPLLPPMGERSNVIGKNSGILNNAEQDYTPQDIAEYIFWTGDESRVAEALNDFLQNELVSKQSAYFRFRCSPK